MATTGDNSDKLIKDYAKRISGYMDQLDECKEQTKEIRTDMNLVFKGAANAGVDPKALRQVVNEMRMEPAQREAQLVFEFNVDDYRMRVGLRTAASQQAAEAA